MMRKSLLMLLIVIGAIGVYMLTVQVSTESPSSKRDTSGELCAILNALDVSSSKDGLKSHNSVGGEDRLKNRQQAIKDLRSNSSRLLPQLMDEVNAIGFIESTNLPLAASRTERLDFAFEVLGSGVRPLLPELRELFYSGRSIGPCVSAFRHIGGTDCGLILVSGITNSDPLVRNACMSVLSDFATNREVSVAAIPVLVDQLDAEMQFSRALAASVLGTIRQNPDEVIGRLIKTAKEDPDFVVRISAVKAIGNYGTNAVTVLPDLENIAATDPDSSVRRLASKVTHTVKGETPPRNVR